MVGTAHILEAARRTPSVVAIVNVTSDKCYENKEQSSVHKETDPLGGNDPYSASKAAAEIISAAYRRSFFQKDCPIAMATVRAGNVIGGGDWAENRLVPDVTRALVKGEPIKLRHPAAVRPWQHVFEPLRGYLMLGYLLATQGSEYAESWNFGPSAADAVSVKEITEMIMLNWAGANAIETVDSSFGEAETLQLNTEKAQQRLKWFPLLDVRDGVEYTVSWYRGYQEENADMRAFSQRQISNYMSQLDAASPR